ncbi:MAG: hypothetical protein LBV74_13090 [Tannerella sp.]|jgi:hypothetical protein|nr:hypothetical protein [Tannerella sp.]
MNKIRKYFRDNSYIVALTVVTIVVGVLHFATNDMSSQIWIRQSTANLFITILGIWITVLCIDQIIKKKEQREKNRLLDVAYREISRALEWYLFCLDRIYRVSSNGKPEFKDTYREMYDTDHFREAFLNCDFSKIAGYQNCTSGQFLHSRTNDFIANIDKIISKYSFVLDSDTLRWLELLKGHIFVTVSSQMENPEGKRDVIYGFYNEFLKLLFVIEEIIVSKSGNLKLASSHVRSMWDDESFEKLGAARFDSNN